MYLLIFVIGAFFAFRPARAARLAGQGSAASVRAVRITGVATIFFMVTAVVLIA